MKRWQKWLIGIVIALIALGAVGYIFRDDLVRLYTRPTESSLSEQTANAPEVVAENLTTLWSMAFLPNGDMLVTERSGKLQQIGEDGQTFTIEGVQETSEGGLLGVELAPDFAESSQVYLYYTTGSSGNLTNQVESYILAGDRLENRTTIIAGIPAASNHNGGGMKFGPDGKLYITTGDATEPELAQDRGSLAGKILRLNPDGSTPDDNPFGNEIWSYGHRNPQGIAWDGEGRMWAVEHGQSSQDELNRIERGANYGWPTIRGDETQDGMRSPVLHSGNNETWAPSGLAYHDGKLYFAGLRGQALYVVDISHPNDVKAERLFSNQYGRLRAVAVRDSHIYFSTSNKDGRGNPASDDDKILKFLAN